MSEVLRLLGEQEDLAGTVGGSAPMELGLPQGILEVIGQRLNGLSADCVDVLALASVIGRQFDFNLLQLLCDEITEAKLLDLVEEALNAHILEELPSQGDRYEFSHALVQQTLLEGISNSRKVRTHARIGQLLETLYKDNLGVHAAELAYHFSIALPVTGQGKFVEYSGLAGERALEAYAHEDALDHFQAGLMALGVDLEGSLPAPDEQSAALFFGLGRSQVALLDDAAYPTLRRALDYYASCGDLERVVSIAEFPDYQATRRIGPEQLVARAMSLVPAGTLQSGRLLSRYGQIVGLQDAAYEEAIDALNQALVISRHEGDGNLELQSLAAVTSVHSNHMRYVEALDTGLTAIELAKRVHDPRSAVSAHYFVITSLIENGELGEAKSHASEMVSQAGRLGDRFWQEGTFWKSEITLRLSGEWDLARSSGQRALGIGSRPANEGQACEGKVVEVHGRYSWSSSGSSSAGVSSLRSDSA